MPMIDIYAPAGIFPDVHRLASDAAAAVMEIEQAPDIAMFRQNVGAFVHEMPTEAISDVEGGSRHVRVQVLTNAGALDRDKQIAVVERLTNMIAAAANDATLKERTWVLLTEAAPGGWGLWGHAHTNEELVEVVRLPGFGAQGDEPSGRLGNSGGASASPIGPVGRPRIQLRLPRTRRLLIRLVWVARWPEGACVASEPGHSQDTQ
ncbi:MAG: hypothetical protein WA642_22365 [Steroidobacteraceae bacterium]